MAIALFLVMAGLCGVVGGSEELLTVNQGVRMADVIVVLGGEAEHRSEKAIELYRRGVAPKILVVGRNEEAQIGRRLRAAGIPETALGFEPTSASTYENAVFSLPHLRRWRVKSLLLVTSWFHSRRAAAVFISVPGMPKVISAPTDALSVGTLLSSWRVLLQVFKEYPKIVAYWVMYGISPVLSESSQSDALSSHDGSGPWC